MALETKVEFKSIDKAGGIIKIHDTTGLFSTDNPGGYGNPNTTPAAIQKVVFTIGGYADNKVFTQTHVRTFDPLNPTWIYEPSVDEVISGADIIISARTLAMSDIMLGFEDGVYDLNMYSILNTPVSNVIIGKGNPFIVGTNLDQYLIYDSVLIGDKYYDIDKSKSTNGGTVLFLAQESLILATTFTPTYRANTKFIIDVDTTACLYNKVGKLAAQCDCDIDKLKGVLQDIELFRWASTYAFKGQNYVQATQLIEAARDLCKGDCGC